MTRSRFRRVRKGEPSLVVVVQAALSPGFLPGRPGAEASPPLLDERVDLPLEDLGGLDRRTGQVVLAGLLREAGHAAHKFEWEAEQVVSDHHRRIPTACPRDLYG